MDHGWLVRFVEHRIADQRVVRLIQKWLNAGVLEEGERTRERGRDGAGRQHQSAAGEHLPALCLRPVGPPMATTRGARRVIVVRYADDFVVGFQHRAEAERFLADLRERFARFGLELHPDKTRLLEFGRYAARPASAAATGNRRPSTSWASRTSVGRRGTGRFTVLRQTMRTADAGQAAGGQGRTAAAPAPAPSGSRARSCAAVVRGHVRYYGVPLNGTGRCRRFRRAVGRLWHRAAGAPQPRRAA